MSRRFRYDINAKNVCTILVTNECNIKCEFCVAENFVESNGKFIDLENLQLEELANQGVKFITLSGGEPTLYSDLHKLTHKLKESNLFDGICIITNFTKPENLVKCVEDLQWLRENLDDRVTIACSTLRLSNGWCIQHQADEEYWRKQGKETTTNRVIISLDDGTDIVLRTASTDITGEDPVEEELVLSWDGSLHRGFKDLISLTGN